MIYFIVLLGHNQILTLKTLSYANHIFQKEIDTIYLIFSDPWPKKHNDKKRFTHINYLKKYDKIFKKQIHIILKTDNKGFFVYSLEILSNYLYTFKRVISDLHMMKIHSKYYDKLRKTIF